jgi:hypothetical protein
MTTTQVGTKLGIRKITARIGAEITGLPPTSSSIPPDQPQRTPSDSSAERFACTDATARNASRR